MAIEQGKWLEQLGQNPPIEMYRYTPIVGTKGPIYIIGNTSAALIEGSTSTDPLSPDNPSPYDAYDSGGQMLPFASPESTVLVQMPGDENREANIDIATQMYLLEIESLQRMGIATDVKVQFVTNAHAHLASLSAAKTDFRLTPLFLSTRLLGETNPQARASAEVNDKVNFIRTLKSIDVPGVAVRVPDTYIFDAEQYPESGFPPVDELIATAAEKGSTALFFKQNVSAAGIGVEKVDIKDREKVEQVYAAWVDRMRQTQQGGSTAWDFHIQIGVSSPKISEADGAVESPCIVATIEGEGTDFKIQILQVAQQRIANGKNHIGNVIDPEYEATFLAQHEDELMAALRALAEKGVRGHVGIDVILDTAENMYFIEVNPRLNGNSRCRILRDHLSPDAFVTTNNTVKLSADNLSNMEALRAFFFDPANPERASLALTRFPRFIGDAMALDFINDRDGMLERQVLALLQPPVTA